MFNMIFENKDGKQLKFDDGSPYTITEFQGFNPPKSVINTNQTATLDGGTFNSSKLEMRNINVAFAIETDAEKNRLDVYKVVQSKMPLRIYYKSDYLDVFADGYVEDVNITYFAKKNIVTVSVLCPFPYLKGSKEVVNQLSSVEPKFYYPFASEAAGELVMGEYDTLTSVTVNNDGSCVTGLTFEFYAKEPLSNPKVLDYFTAEYMEIDIEMQRGDLITITTEQGNKSVTLLRNGIKTNIFNLLTKQSTWLQLDIGGGIYVYEVGTGRMIDLEVTIKHYDLYEGV